MTKPSLVFCKQCQRAHEVGQHISLATTRPAPKPETAADKILKDRRAKKAAQMKRYRAKLKIRSGEVSGRGAAASASDAATLGSSNKEG